jgi:transglutaminase-like putative cysteine protease
MLHPTWKRYVFLLPWLLILLVACRPVRVDAPQPPTSKVLLKAPPPSNPDLDLQAFSAASITESREYDVREQLVLVNQGSGEPSKQNLWIALISDIDPYQIVTKREISPDNYKIFTDEDGNQIAEFDFSEMPAGAEIRVQIDTHVRVNRLAYNLADCEGKLPGFFTQPELHIESNNPQIIALADQLSEGEQTACEQARAFYDYIGNNLVYSFNGRNWGAQAALGEMGADCTEYASLMVALSRAAGIPARYLEGVLFLDKSSEKLARTEHAWLEVYLPGTGWTAIDPTLGRSSIFREDYFAAYSPDHIIVTRGSNPSALRGASYFTHIYWPGNSTVIKVTDFNWLITPSK